MLPNYFASESDPRWYLPLLGGRSPEDCSGEEIISLKSEVHRQIAASRARGSIFTKTHNRWGGYNEHALHNVAVIAGAIYLVRNPLDVVPSTADHVGLNIDAAIDFMANEDTGTPSNMENVVSYLGSWSSRVASCSRQSH